MFDYGDLIFIGVVALCFGFMSGRAIGFKDGKREGFIRGKVAARKSVNQ
jgi:hypothetical protein